MHIVAPVLILAGLGILFGIGLAFASRKFFVKTDERIEKVLIELPGVNCGGCGQPGCAAFAECLVHATSSVNECVVSSEDARLRIAKILGVEAKPKARKVSVLHCHGGRERVKDKFVYTGIKDCYAANLVMGGPKACVYGCIGFGTCVKACPFGAITMGKDDLPVVNEDKCTSCGKCVSSCPKKLYEIILVSKNYLVRCKSLDAGKAVMQVCSAGCIGCGKCEKACPVSVIKLVDNLAVIGYHVCDNRGECFKACPVKTIAVKENKVWKGKA